MTMLTQMQASCVNKALGSDYTKRQRLVQKIFLDCSFTRSISGSVSVIDYNLSDIADANALLGVNGPLGPVYTKRQHQHCDNVATTLAILFSLKTMESLENRLQLLAEVSQLFSLRIESLVSSRSCLSVDADA